MAKKMKITTGLIIVGAVGAGIKCWLDNQKPEEAKLDDLRVPPPPLSPTAFTATPLHREVTATWKDEHGVIASLHGEWGMVSKGEAISDIEAGRASYAVAGGQTLVSWTARQASTFAPTRTAATPTTWMSFRIRRPSTQPDRRLKSHLRVTQGGG